MNRYNSKKTARTARTKAKTSSLERPKLSVYRSNKYIYAQVIDLKKGRSLTGVRGKDPAEVGKKIAAKSLKLGVKEIVFDRGAYRYHGRVKKLADGAREAGLKF